MAQEARTRLEILAELRQNLATHFNREELRTLCFDLDIDHENLPEAKDSMARELVAHCERRQCILELARKCRKLRPEVAWPSLPANIFICYQRHADADRKLATYLQGFLAAQGHHVFIDTTMRTGEVWLEEIDQQVKASDFLIVLLSKSSADSEMVKAEVSRAYEYRQSQRHPHILPVRIAYEGLLPYAIAAFLNPLQYVVWQSEADNERLSHDILAAVEGRLPERPPIQARPVVAGFTVSEDGRVITDDNSLHPALPEFDAGFLEELEAPGGAVKLRDRFYIEREADNRLKREVVKQGSTTTIRAARQTGKSSLLVRGVQHACEHGAKVVYLDMSRVDKGHLERPELDFIHLR